MFITMLIPTCNLNCAPPHHPPPRYSTSRSFSALKYPCPLSTEPLGEDSRRGHGWDWNGLLMALTEDLVGHGISWPLMGIYIIYYYIMRFHEHFYQEYDISRVEILVWCWTCFIFQNGTYPIPSRDFIFVIVAFFPTTCLVKIELRVYAAFVDYYTIVIKTLRYMLLWKMCDNHW